MKKHLILFLMAGALALSSCSKDEEEIGTDDPIIGTWALVQVSPQNPFFNPDDCTEQSTMTFTENNIATGTFYLANNNCEGELSAGTWSNQGNSVYKLSVPFVGSQEFSVDFEGSGTFSISFQEAQLIFERQ